MEYTTGTNTETKPSRSRLRTIVEITVAIILMGGAVSFLNMTHCKSSAAMGVSTITEAHEEASVVDCSHAIDDKTRDVQLMHALKEWRANNAPTSGIIAKTLYHCMTEHRRSPVKLGLTDRETTQIIHAFSQ